jgi:cell wall-associated NlpC family hydrolase
MLPRSVHWRLRVVVGLVVAAVLAGAVGVPGVAGADELSDKRAEAERVTAQLARLQDQTHELSDEAELAKGELLEAEQAVAEAEEAAAEAQAQMELRQSELRSFAVQAYVTGGSADGFDALLTSTTDDAPKVRGYLDVTTGNRQDLVDQLQATRKKAADQGETLSEARAALEQRNAAVKAKLDQAQSAVAEQASIKSRLDGEVGRLVAEEEARQAAAAQRAAEEQARQQAAEATSRAAAAPAVGAPTTVAPAPPRLTAPAPVTNVGPPPAVSPGAAGAVEAAMSRIGSPYVWAAGGPNAFDCSGLTMWAWAQAGRSLPHYTGSQWAMSRPVSVGDAQPGDLVFFWGKGDGDPSHVGLYIGGGSMVHAPGAGRSVRVESIHYWSGARLAIGRI